MKRMMVALTVATVLPGLSALAADAGPPKIVVTYDVKHDVSPPLRDITCRGSRVTGGTGMFEPKGFHGTVSNGRDTVVQGSLAPAVVPPPILNFTGIPFPGVGCNCAPPDTDGEVGATQYVQMVNRALQVWDKVTGVSQLGPIDIEVLWAGFGGVCQSTGFGDPVVEYDQIANRWLVSQFAGTSMT